MDLQPFYRRKRLLLTGSTGYLATSLIYWLKDIDCHLIRLSRPGATFPPVYGRATVQDVAGDIGEFATWESVLANGVDVIFHLAAQTNCYTSNADPAADQAINVTPMLHLLEACRQGHQRPAVIFAGTVTQAGLPAHLPVDEGHPDRPATIYDLHKLVSEQYLAYYSRQEVVNGATLRLANVYGPGPASSGPGRGMLNTMVRRALQGEPLTIYGRGEFVRDFVYIQDVVRAFLLAGVHSGRLQGQHFIIGSGRGCTLAEAIGLVSERVALVTGRPASVVQVEPPAGLLPIEFRHFVADSRRAQLELGWQTEVSLEQGIDQTIAYFLAKNGMLQP